jgi:hypothetical protein
MPVATAGEDDVTFDGWLIVTIGIDVALPGQDDEELVGVGVTVAVVPRPGWEHGPAKE